MAIAVKTPNGTTVNFPDGTDADTINSVMMQHFGDDNRATFEIKGPDGATYEVKAPDEASALAAFNAHMGGGKPATKLDKYQQAAQADLAASNNLPRAGESYQRQFIHGATLGADTALMAGLETPLEMIKRGTTSPVEGYNYAKAREDAALDQARSDDGLIGTGMEMAGGVVGGGALTKGGITATRALSAEPGIVGSVAANAADAALQGGIQGFNEGNGIDDRINKAVTGAATGAGIGGGLSAGGAVVGGMIGKVASAVRGHFNPEAAARAQIARAVTESGQTPAGIEAALQQAQSEGQGNFTVADALGSSGQRMLSTIARANGEGRTNVVNYLENRQAGQGRRVANALSEGFETPETAAQTERRLTQARNETADTEFGAVRDDARPVDLTQAIARIDQTLSPGVNQIVSQPAALGNDTIEAALQRFRGRMTDGRANLSDFTAVQRLRGDLSDAVQSAQRSGHGNQARVLRGVLREVDQAMETASDGYLAANRNFAQATRNIEAIDQGRTAAVRGRSEDTIPAFGGLTPEGQAAFRAGYADPLIEQAQGGAFGVNKARPLTSDAFRDEAAAMAPGNDLMQRRIARENTMFQTRNTALGGSKTADNLADQEAMGIDPTLAMGVIANLVHGNIPGAVHALGHAGASFLGNTAAVRAAVGRYLLQNGANLTPGQLQAAINQTMARIQRNARMAQTLGTISRSAITTVANEARNRQ
jgi:hypothetical protein